MRRLLIIVALLWTLNLAAQDKWSLQKCIDYSLEHSIRSNMASMSSKLARANLIQSNMAFLPSLNGNATHNYNYGRNIDQYAGRFVDQRTQTNNLFLSADVILFNGFQLQNTRKQNKFDYEASKKDAEQVRNDVTLAVITNYLQVLFNSEYLVTAQLSVESTRKQLDRVKALVSSGASAKGSQLDMEAQLASEELNEVNAQNRLDLSILDLTQSMNLDSASGFEIQKPDLSSYNYTILQVKSSDIYNVAVKTQPSVMAGDMRVQAARYGLSTARGSRSPRLSLSGSYGSGYSDARQQVVGYQKPDSALFGYFSNIPVYYTPTVGDPILEKTPFNTQFKDNLNKSFGLSLSIPFFNGWQSKTAIDRAKINFKQAELNLEQTKDQLQKNIELATADALAALRRYNASSKSVSAMTESFNYTEQKFNLGLSNALDFLTAKNNLQKAKSDMLQAQYEYVFKTKILDFYLGNPLSF